MSAEMILMIFLLALSVVLLYRVVAGPTDPDRIIAISTVSAIVSVVLAVYAFQVRRSIYVDIALAVALLDFIMVLAYSRYIRGEL
ncbi:membrane bound hydrogenase subunit MbxB [Coprothermobacteraceae bacterium]|nr:membrane bound hydrogenase subunit MbxB [Coprothermobacteraceae bacterium]